MEFITIGRIAPQRRWHMPLHVHRDYHELIVVVQGRLQTRICGQTLVGGPGDVFFYPAGQPHVEEAASRSVLETYFLAWRGDLDVSTWPMIQRDVSGHIEHAARWMHELDRSPDHGGTRARDALLDLILHELGTGSRSTKDQVIPRVERHVQRHLADALRLEDLARVAGMSRFHFARLFVKSTGISPMAYVREARIRAARTLLLTTPLPLRAIAPMVGFADQPHLSRVFFRMVGQTPGRFRRSANL